MLAYFIRLYNKDCEARRPHFTRRTSTHGVGSGSARLRFNEEVDPLCRRLFTPLSGSVGNHARTKALRGLLSAAGMTAPWAPLSAAG